MSQTIWKYQLRAPAYQSVPMPEGAVVLHVAEQDGAVCLWAAVEPDAPLIGWPIHVVGTGHPIPDGVGRHLGTVLMAGGRLVWHIFESAA